MTTTSQAALPAGSLPEWRLKCEANGHGAGVRVGGRRAVPGLASGRTARSVDPRPRIPNGASARRPDVPAALTARSRRGPPGTTAPPLVPPAAIPTRTRTGPGRSPGGGRSNERLRRREPGDARHYGVRRNEPVGRSSHEPFYSRMMRTRTDCTSRVIWRAASWIGRLRDPRRGSSRLCVAAAEQGNGSAGHLRLPLQPLDHTNPLRELVGHPEAHGKSFVREFINSAGCRPGSCMRRQHGRCRSVAPSHFALTCGKRSTMFGHLNMRWGWRKASGRGTEGSA